MSPRARRNTASRIGHAAPSAGDVILSAESVSVTAGRAELLADVDAEVRVGEVLGLIGPNGAGKSTLLAALAGDVRPAHGEVRLFGERYSAYSAREAARLRAVMLQDPTVSFAHLVRDVVEMGRAAWPGDPAGDDALVDRCLAEVDMAGMDEREITTLSGGERARVAFARVLAQSARCLLLDEPTAAMDIGHAERTMGSVRRVAAEGVGVAVVLHDLGAAARYCDRLALLDSGRIRAIGAPAEVLSEELLSEVY
ncbi:heme ABC transporter ATP-binding protein, partial [Dietzia sp.]|uniref:heme ABC transporter ATP-binding protein n=1 Tax=Dietzia sp. TaxID=1871616 RepID=UPI002FDB7B2B